MVRQDNAPTVLMLSQNGRKSQFREASGKAVSAKWRTKNGKVPTEFDSISCRVCQMKFSESVKNQKKTFACPRSPRPSRTKPGQREAPDFLQRCRLRSIRTSHCRGPGKFPVELIAYQWMNNHWHMVLSPNEDGGMGEFWDGSR